jgi:hypothetical protein
MLPAPPLHPSTWRLNAAASKLKPGPDLAARSSANVTPQEPKATGRDRHAHGPGPRGPPAAVGALVTLPRTRLIARGSVGHDGRKDPRLGAGTVSSAVHDPERDHRGDRCPVTLATRDVQPSQPVVACHSMHAARLPRRTRSSPWLTTLALGGARVVGAAELAAEAAGCGAFCSQVPSAIDCTTSFGSSQTTRPNSRRRLRAHAIGWMQRGRLGSGVRAWVTGWASAGW